MKPAQAFLTAVLGARGAAALQPLSKASPDLAAYVVPRAAVAWLQLTSDFEGALPGTDTICAFRKSEDGYTGILDDYAFTSAPMEHLAAAVSVLLDAAPGRPDLRDLDLARLGKTIDALAKTQKKRGAGGEAGTGVAAAPIPPDAPEPPTSVAPPKPKPGKLPKLAKPKKPVVPQKLALSVADSQKSCPVCRGTQFRGTEFRGCYCLRGLAKSVDVRLVATGFELTFGAGWDADTIAILRESLRHGR